MALTRVSTGGIQDDAVTDAKLPANSVGNSEMKDDAVGIAELSATGTASSSTFLRGDNTWVTPTDTNTQLTTEEVQDIVGAMFTGNTETNITATYQDADGTIDLVSTDTDTQVGGATGVDFNDDVKVRFGTGNDLEIFHNGYNSKIADVGTGALILSGSVVKIENGASNETQAVFTEDGAVELYYNNSKKLETSTNGTTLTGNLFISDSADTDSGRIKLGAGEDLQIYHEGANSYLNDTGTGSLILKSSEIKLHSATGEDLAKFTPDGAAELYYDNTKKLETVTGGVTVTGTCTATAFAGDGSSLTGVSTSGGSSGIDFNDNVKARFGTGNDLEIYHDGSSNLITSSTANTWIKNTAEQGFANGSEYEIRCTANAGVHLYYDNSLKLDTLSGGVQVHGNLYQHDNAKAVYGTSDDFEIYSGGTGAKLHCNTGVLELEGDSVQIWNHAANEAMAKFTADAGVELYYNNSKKFETHSWGVKVLNDLIVPDNGIIRLGNATYGDLKIYHDGTDNYIYSDDKTLYINANSTGSAKIQIAAINTEKNADFKPNGAVELYYDNSKKFETTSSGASVTGHLNIPTGYSLQWDDSHERIEQSDGKIEFFTGNGEKMVLAGSNLEFPDNGSVLLGTGDDLQLYHDGTNNIIRNVGTRLDIIVNSSETAAKFNPNGAVELYYDDSRKLRTTSTGIAVEDHIDMDDGHQLRLGSGADFTLDHNGSDGTLNNQTGNLRIRNAGEFWVTKSSTENMLIAKPDGAVELYYDNVLTFDTSSSGPRVYGNLRMEGDDRKIVLGTGSDLQIWHSGTNTFFENTTGNVYFRNDGANTYFQMGSSNETGIAIAKDDGAFLYFNDVQKLQTTANGVSVTGNIYTDGNVNLTADDKKIRLGAGEDLQIYHDGTTNIITGTNTTLSLRAKTGENGLLIVADNAASLYFDDSVKLATDSGGVNVTGGLNASGNIVCTADNGKFIAGAGDDLQLWHTGSASVIRNTTGNLSIQTTSNLWLENEDGSEVYIKAIDDAQVELYYDNSKKLETAADGVLVNDNVKYMAGYSADLQIYHDGSNSYIKQVSGGVGDLLIFADGHDIEFITQSGEHSAMMKPNGAVELYYDDSKKFETKSTGVEISGRLSVNEGGQLVNESGLTVDAGGNTACFRASGAAGHNPIMCWNSHTSGDRSQIQFADGGSYTSRGSITTNGSNVTYGGTSDYRLKQDDVLITDGITKVKALKPKRFKWKDNLSIGICDGFFAHEVQETAPTSGATIGTKDAVDSDGNPVYQQVDQAKLIPILTAALQEAISKIETLETKVAALESS